MRWMVAAAMAAASTSAMAQSIDDVAQAAVNARDACLTTVDAKARQKKLSAETYKIVLEGACREEHLRARELFGQALDAAIPAGLSFDTGPTRARYLGRFDTQFEQRKAKLVSDFVLGN